ncbi:hypoxia up-regulated protein 1-like [Ctenocephalides felis]|uniref:hypoxia up-regulated protein 1-like n=1 Tax=Ctenocephalides felis TaxID=7515 RepID=UPI000E6E12E2|nr:hypoxia up-regulated protein 1-like [Ctenocephalides felis]
MNSLVVLIVCLTIGFLSNNVQSAAVMSVDLGNEWMKVGVVSPGVPMEIVLNKESKRKTPAVVAFRDGIRSFGEDAQTIGVRFPAQSYAYLLDLLGKSIDHPVVKLYQKRFPYYKIEADPVRNTVVFRHDDDTTYSVEELVAQLLSKAREMAQISTGQIITECVLTVPGYFGQAERLALLQATSLAELKPLQLINDYSAVALNYGIFRRKEINETSHYIMFYDMGAHKTTATIVEYKIVKTKDRGYVETNPQLQVIGVGYDRTLGGLEMTLRLQNYLAKEFNAQKKTSSDITKNARAMAKLFKEANRVKTVLSANNDHFAQVEGLIDEKDYRLQITRATFEDLCKDLFERVTKPIDMALSKAGLSMDIMSQFILVGAGTRVPKVQEVLHKKISMELSKNINADEAATLGAAYRAADLSKGFKVKQFHVRDAVLFPIQVTFERASTEGDEPTDNQSTKLSKRTLFGSMNPYPQKKVITFNKHQRDFDFQVKYSSASANQEESTSNDFSDIDLNGEIISEVKLNGVTDLVKGVKENTEESKGIKAHFEMDDSGVLRLLNVDFVIERKVEDVEESTLSKLGSTISNLFSGKTEKPETEEVNEKEVPGTEETSSDDKKLNMTVTNTTASQENVTSTDTGNKTESAGKPKIVTVKEPVKMVNTLKLNLMTDDDFQKSYKKIETLNKLDAERQHRETALNQLESFVIEAQLRMDLEEYTECGVEEEIEKIKTMCSEVSDWIYDEGVDATAEQYEDKLHELQKLTLGIYEKHFEHHERPEAVKAIHSMLNGSSNFLATAKNLTKDANPDKDVFTKVEIETLEKIINETTEWLEQMIKEQDETKKNEPVKLTIKALTDKMAALDREVKYLVNKIKIWKPKTTEKPKTANDSETVKNPEDIKPIVEEPENDTKPNDDEDILPSEFSEDQSDSESNKENLEETLTKDDKDDDHSEL